MSLNDVIDSFGFDSVFNGTMEVPWNSKINWKKKLVGRDDHHNHFHKACPMKHKDTRNEVRLTAVCNNTDCGLFKDGAWKKNRE